MPEDESYRMDGGGTYFFWALAAVISQHKATLAILDLLNLAQKHYLDEHNIKYNGKIKYQVMSFETSLPQPTVVLKAKQAIQNQNSVEVERNGSEPELRQRLNAAEE